MNIFARFLFLLIFFSYSCYSQTNSQLNKIEKLAKQEKTEEGLNKINQFISKDSTIADAYAIRSTLLRRTGKYELAKKDAQKAIRLDPNNYKALTELGTIHVMLKKFEEALQYYDKSIQVNPYYAPSYTCRGALKVYYLNMTEDGLSDYNVAITLDSKSHSAFYNRGLYYNDRGEYNKAILDFNRSLSILKKQSKVNFDRGIAFANTGKYKMALRDFKKAREYNSKLDPYERIDEKSITEWEEYCKGQLKE
jgi:tetratricopeptide (TPR) repeat protein